MVQGEVLSNAHLLGTFHRLCRLLFHRIRPIMVFDGGVPEIKRQTVLARVRRRVDEEEQTRRTAKRLLQKQLAKRAMAVRNNPQWVPESLRNAHGAAALHPVKRTGRGSGRASSSVPSSSQATKKKGSACDAHTTPDNVEVPSPRRKERTKAQQRKEFDSSSLPSAGQPKSAVSTAQPATPTAAGKRKRMQMLREKLQKAHDKKVSLS